MKIFFILMISISTFCSSAYPFDIKGEGCGTDCIQCHKISKDEASVILNGFVDKVMDVKDGPVKGMWMVEVEAKGRIFPLYLHYSKKYFFAGNIVDIKNRKLIGEEPRPAEKKKVDLNKIPLDDAIVMGNPLAKKGVVVFDDPDCPYCRKLHAEIKKVISQRNDIVFYIKLFPLVKLHPDAYRKSKSIICEKSLEKSFKMLDDAFSGKEIPNPRCETTKIDDNIKLGDSLGITGTPTLILPDGTVISGYLTADNLIALIDGINTKK